MVGRATSTRLADSGLEQWEDEYAKQIALGKDQTAAYKIAKPYCQKWQNHSIRIEASKAAAREDIRTRIAEYMRAAQAESENNHRVTAASLTSDALTVFSGAMQDGQRSAAVSALRLVAEINGYLVESRRNNKGPLEDFSPEQVDAALKALGVEIPPSTDKPA